MSFENHPSYKLYNDFLPYSQKIISDFNIQNKDLIRLLDSNEKKVIRAKIVRELKNAFDDSCLKYKEPIDNDGIEYVEYPIVEINTGTLMLLYDILKVLVSNDKLFPSWGGKSNKAVKIPSLFVEDYNIFLRDTKYIEMPELDARRTELLDNLFIITLKFLFVHEAVHIADGHLAYKYYVENDHKNIQALEILSDVVAVRKTYYDYTKTVSEMRLNNQDDFSYNVFYIFTLYFLMRIFTPPENKHVKPRKDGDHPPVVIRWRNIVNVFYSTFYEPIYIRYRGDRADNYKTFIQQTITPGVITIEILIKQINEMEDHNYFWDQVDYLDSNIDVTELFENRISRNYIKAWVHLLDYQTIPFDKLWKVPKIFSWE